MRSALQCTSIRFLVISLTISAAGCAETPGVKQSSSESEVSLRESAIFHAKLSYVLKEAGLVLEYEGSLGSEWIFGIQPSWQRYNLWRVDRLCHNNGEVCLPNLTRDERNAGVRSGELQRQTILVFRLMADTAGERRILLHLGKERIAVEIASIVHDLRVDDVIPELGITARELLVKVESKTFLDPAFGI